MSPSSCPPSALLAVSSPAVARIGPVRATQRDRPPHERSAAFDRAEDGLAKPLPRCAAPRDARHAGARRRGPSRRLVGAEPAGRGRRVPGPGGRHGLRPLPARPIGGGHQLAHPGRNLGRPARHRAAHPQHPHLCRAWRAGADPRTRRGPGARPARGGGRLARPQHGAQRGRDPQPHPHRPDQPQREPRDRRQRVGAARRPDPRPAHRPYQPGARPGAPAGDHRGAVARLAGPSGAGARGRCHHHPPAAVLGRPAGRRRAALHHGEVRPGRRPVPGQADRHRRGGLALRRP